MPIKPGVNIVISAKEILGLSSYSDTTAILSLTNAYQDLVAAPATGIRRINQVTLSNEDASVGADFAIKLVKAGVDYAIVQLYLSPGENLTLIFPWLLDTTVKMQAKTSVTCTGKATASHIPYYGGNGLVNFTGTAWATLLTVAAAKNILGVVLVNNEDTPQTLSLQIIDGSSNVKSVWSKTLSAGSSWFKEVNFTLPAGYSLQVKQGAALKSGSAFISYAEV